MTREEILEKSRKESNGMDEREQHITSRAGNISMTIGLLLCALINLINVRFDGPTVVTFTAWTIYWGTSAADNWCKAFWLKKRSYWLTAGFYTILFLMFAYLFLSHTIPGI